MMKACSKCGKIHPYNYKCNAGKRYKPKDSEAAKIRATAHWKEKSKQIKDDAHFVCEWCLHEGRIRSVRLEVHHIVPLEEDPTLAFEDGNLICLCQSHHRDAEQGKISREDLSAIVARRIASFEGE